MLFQSCLPCFLMLSQCFSMLFLSFSNAFQCFSKFFLCFSMLSQYFSKLFPCFFNASHCFLHAFQCFFQAFSMLLHTLSMLFNAFLNVFQCFFQNNTQTSKTFKIKQCFVFGEHVRKTSVLLTKETQHRYGRGRWPTQRSARASPAVQSTNASGFRP